MLEGFFFQIFKTHLIFATNWVSESEVTQSYPTLCDPIDCSLPGSSVHEIFQATVLEWIAISFSRGSFQPRDWTLVSHIVDRCFTAWANKKYIKLILFQFSSVQSLSRVWLCDPMNCSMPGLPVHHQLLEFTQTHIHRVGDASQLSHQSVVPFSSSPQSLPASESFPISQLFTWGGQSTGVSALASFLPRNPRADLL